MKKDRTLDLNTIDTQCSDQPDTGDHECAGVIPNTFIMCGEDGNYCSTECQEGAPHGHNEEDGES